MKGVLGRPVALRVGPGSPAGCCLAGAHRGRTWLPLSLTQSFEQSRVSTLDNHAKNRALIKIIRTEKRCLDSGMVCRPKE